MKMYWRKLNRFLIAGILPFLLVSLHLQEARAKVFDRVVAKVNDEIITLSGLQERMNAELVKMRQAGMPNDYPLDELKEKLLDRMIDEKLQLQDGKKIGLTVGEERILQALDDIKKANNIDDEQFSMMLKREGTSLEQYKETIHNQIMVQKVVGYQVNNRTQISEEELKSYYMRHRKDYHLPPRVKARHILFILNDVLTEKERELKEKKAEEVKKRLDAGESFEKLAKEFSEDVSASNGGDLGILDRGKMVIDLENAIFALRSGEISDLIRTPYGIHIAKVDKVIPGGFTPLEEVKNDIEQKLRSEKFQKNYDGYMQDLRKAAFIEKTLSGRKRPPPALSTKGQTRQSALGNKLPPLEIPTASSRNDAPTQRKQTRRTVRSTRSKPSSDPNSILPPLTIGKPNASPAPPREARRVEKTPITKPGSFEEVQQALKKLKKMRDARMISESEYQKKKEELLNQL